MDWVNTSILDGDQQCESALSQVSLIRPRLRLPSRRAGLRDQSMPASISLNSLHATLTDTATEIDPLPEISVLRGIDGPERLS